MDNDLSFKYLNSYIEKENVDFQLKLTCERIIQAENDWKDSFEFVLEFITEIERIIGGETSKHNIENKLKSFETNIYLNMWAAESFSSLLEIFEYNEKITLKEIFLEISKKMKIQ